MVSDDVILEQVEYTYDAAGNVILIVRRQRYHNAPDSQTGPLNDPGLAPKARVTYLALYPDALGRIVATADYGTNGGAAFTRSDTIPTRSDTVLVNSVEFDSAGNVLQTTDPKGIVTRFEYDAVGREITRIENYRASGSSSSSSSSSSAGGDANRITRTTYTPDGLQATLVAENADTGNQTTTYTYGTTLSDSDLATSTLLRTVAYPDSTGGGDTLTFSYNRQGERTTATDQRGCVHTYDRDLLGRLAQDRVTTLGTGVDGAIRRLSATFDVRGLPSLLTSHDHATVGSGSVVNQVLFAYNGFAQVTHDYQSHAGSVNTSTSPRVQLAYANGSANTIRPTSLVYPDGRTLTYGYGTTDGIDDAASRVASLVDDDGGSTHLADYSFLGLGATVVVDFTEPDVKYTLVDLSGTNDPDTGDIYSGLDRFGRVKDCRWHDYGASADTARLKHGYDRASNRLWREDTVAVSLSKNFDELYAYDNLHRLADLQRGRLNGGHTSISSKTFAQAWTLDATGNWQGFEEAATGGSLTLDQSRASNEVNEITGITNSVGSAWATPAHDPAGNMTTIPKPSDPTTSFTATYDAWNRQVKLVNTSNSQTVQENQYDARTFRTVRRDYTSGTLSEERHCYYTPGWRCVEERLGSSPDSADPDRQFVWGNRYIDDLVCRDRSVSGTLDERLYATQDANWNVVALTDTTGTVQERYAYAPYGMTNVLTAAFVARAASSYAWETTYCGYRWDAGSGLLAVRFRFYHPALGMWLTRDPIGYADGANLYGAYFVPNGIDPFGTSDNEWAHLFPLYLGGSNSQRLFELPIAKHREHHRFLNSRGYPKENPQKALDNFRKLSSRAQRMLILRGMRVSGLTSAEVRVYAKSVFRGATPGCKQNRVGPRDQLRPSFSGIVGFGMIVFSDDPGLAADPFSPNANFELSADLPVTPKPQGTCNCTWVKYLIAHSPLDPYGVDNLLHVKIDSIPLDPIDTTSFRCEKSNGEFRFEVGANEQPTAIWVKQCEFHDYPLPISPF